MAAGDHCLVREVIEDLEIVTADPETTDPRRGHQNPGTTTPEPGVLHLRTLHPRVQDTETVTTTGVADQENLHQKTRV